MRTLEIAVSTKRVLLIDDEPYVREVIQACLQDVGGWDVLAVASAWEGLAQAVAMPPDAIVLDVSMPGMDGFAFLQQVRANSITQHIPIVLLTAKARWFTPQQLQPFGVAGAIAKPFNPLVLTDEIARILGW